MSKFNSNRTANVELALDIMDYIDEQKLPVMELINKKLAPMIPVSKMSGAFAVRGFGESFNIIDNARAEDGGYTRITWTLGSDSYSTSAKGVELERDHIADHDANDIVNIDNQNGLDSYRANEISREATVLGSFEDTDIFVSAYQTAAGTAWDAEAATPELNVRTAAKKIKARKGIAQKHLSLIMDSDTVYNLTTTVTDVKDNLKYTTPVEKMNEVQKLDYLKNYFGVKEIILADQIYNTKGFESAAEFGQIWSGDIAFLAYLAAPSNTWTPGVARQPIHKKALGGREYITERYVDDVKDKTFTRSKEVTGIKIFRDYGQQITGIKTA